MTSLKGWSNIKTYQTRATTFLLGTNHKPIQTRKMANNSLSVFKTETGLELVIDSKTGEAFATQAAYSRMSGVAYDTIRKRISRYIQQVTETALKTDKILTDKGLLEVTLIPANLVFKWLLSDNLDLAYAMGTMGATVYLHQLAGYKIKSEPVETPKPEVNYLPVIEQLDKLLTSCERYKSLFGSINPQFESALKDLIHNTVIDQKQLTGSSECWMGVVNFCEKEFGFVCPKKGEFRDSALGTWVKFYYPHLAQKQESRYCNETNQDIWVYPIHECRDELLKAVKEFIDCPAPGSKLKLDGAFKRNKQVIK